MTVVVVVVSVVLLLVSSGAMLGLLIVGELFEPQVELEGTIIGMAVTSAKASLKISPFGGVIKASELASLGLLWVCTVGR